MSTRSPFMNVSQDLGLAILTFLEVPDLLSFGACSRGNLELGRHHYLWKKLLQEKLGIDDSEGPPGSLLSVPGQLGAPPAAHASFHLYLSWRLSFASYPNELVKRAKLWWRRIENYLSVNFPEMRDTLGPPLTEADIRSVFVEKSYSNSNFLLPPALKVLYRFHDGQHLNGQMRMIQQAARLRRFTSREEVLEVGQGLFGGVSYYDEICVCYLLPLSILRTLNRHSSHYLDTHEYSCTITSLHGEAEAETCHRGLRASEFVLFAVNALLPGQGTEGPIKGFFVGSTTSRSGVYTNMKDSVPVDDDLILTPCMSRHARSRARARSGAGAGAGAGAGEYLLLDWLEEYVSRLERGMFVVEPIKMFATDLEGQQIQADRQKSVQLISLFPRNGECCVTNGVEVSASPVLVTHESSRDSTFGVAENNGEVAASEERSRFFFTYSIRMRLLEDHPSRPGGLGSCQLVSRHWRIADRGEAPPQEVDGPGVVGEFPVLRADRRLPHMFAYQSCTWHARSGTVFRGHLRFRAGAGALWPTVGDGPVHRIDVADTRGQVKGGESTFNAALPPMTLDLSSEDLSFIY